MAHTRGRRPRDSPCARCCTHWFNGLRGSRRRPPAIHDAGGHCRARDRGDAAGLVAAASVPAGPRRTAVGVCAGAGHAISQDQRVVQQLFGRRNAGRHGAGVCRTTRDHWHGTLPGRASLGQRELLGQPLRGAVSLLHALLQPPRAAGTRARVSAGRRGLAAPRRLRALLCRPRQQRTARRAGLLLAGEQSGDPL